MTSKRKIISVSIIKEEKSFFFSFFWNFFLKIRDNYNVGDKMASENNLNKFNKIYDETYSDVLKYIIIKCHDINDANDIIQEVYL